MSVLNAVVYGLNFPPEEVGIAVYTNLLVTALLDNGYSVTVVTAQPYYPQFKSASPYYSLSKSPRLTVYRCPVFTVGRSSSLNRIVLALSFCFSSFPILLFSLFRSPSITFTISPSLILLPSCLLASCLTLKPCPNWLHIQDLEIEAALSLNLLPDNSFISLLRNLESLLCRQFDIVSSISHAMLAKLASKGINQSKLYYLPNMVNTSFFRPILKDSPDILRKKHDLSIPGDCIVCMYSGSLNKKQDVELLIDTVFFFSSSKKIFFLFSVEGPSRDFLESSLGHLPNVAVTNLQPSSTLDVWLNLADIHLLPQKADTSDLLFPSKLLPILSCGLPVVSTAPVGSELYQVTAQFGLTCPPSDLNSFTSAISRLASQPDLRANLGSLGRQYVVQGYSYSKVFGELTSKLNRFTNH